MDLTINNLVLLPQVIVKTVSGSVASWPASGNVTTRPLPILESIQTIVDIEAKEAAIVWEPHPDSYQDEYKVGSTISNSSNTRCSGCSTVLEHMPHNGGCGLDFLWALGFFFLLSSVMCPKTGHSKRCSIIVFHIKMNAIKELLHYCFPCAAWAKQT